MHCLSSVNNHELVIIDWLIETEGLNIVLGILMNITGVSLQ